MNQKTTRSILFIITYTVLLILVLMKFDFLWGVVQQLLSAMKPFFIGFAIAFVLSRPCKFLDGFLRKRLGKAGEKLSRPMAVLLSYVGVILVVYALFSFVLPQVADSIRLFAGRLEGYMANLQVWLEELTPYFSQIGVDLSSLDEYLNQFLNTMLNTVTNAAGLVMALTGSLMSMVVTLVLSVVFSIYMLAGSGALLSQCRSVLHAYVPQPWAGRVREVVGLTASTFNKYISGQLLEACILGCLCAGGMLFIQAEYAPLIGVIVGISALIPVAGAYIGAVVSAFLLLMVSPVSALIFVVFLVILQQIEGNVIYPRVVGTSIGLPGIWVLLAVTVGGGLFGFLGIMLSVPVCSVLYTLLRQDVRRRNRKENKRAEEENE